MTSHLDDRHTESIDEFLRFERFLSDLAARLLNVEPEELDDAIQSSLEELVVLTGGERAGFGQFSEDGRELLYTHGYAAPHAPEFVIGSDVAAVLPWYARELREGRAVVLPRLPDDFPEEAQDEKDFTASKGMKSHFALPLKAGGEVVGGLGIDYYNSYRSWSPELLSRFELLASVYANALYRHRALKRLTRAHDLNRAVLASAASAVLVIDREGRVLTFNDAWDRSDHRVMFSEILQGTELPDVPAEALDARCQDATSLFEGVRSVASGHKPHFEALCHHVGGEQPTVYLVKATPLALEEGGAAVVSTDVTELEGTRARLARSLEDVRELKDQLQAENIVLQQEVRHARGFDEVVGTSGTLNEVLAKVEQVAPTDTPVLLLGETGTGKELIARAIHQRSRRSERPLVTINCAAIPASLVESELFGYEKGAFTGAHQRTIGRFEVAHGGTLFLDEIAELPHEVQAKLLRVLERGEFERLGSSKTIRADMRLIAATNREIEREVHDGRFRDDLYYRLSVFPLELPPLRERAEDIPLLVWHFITRRQVDLGKTVKRVPDRLMKAFTKYPWPGNVRELENVIERSLIVTRGATLAADRLFLQETSRRPSETTLAEMERAHILSVLEACDWKLSGKGNAADRLGLKRSTLQYRMAKLGIHRPVHES